MTPRLDAGELALLRRLKAGRFLIYGKPEIDTLVEELYQKGLVQRVVVQTWDRKGWETSGWSLSAAGRDALAEEGT